MQFGAWPAGTPDAEYMDDSADRDTGHEGKGEHMTGAIFDVDGTLLDSMPIWEDVGERYIRSLHLEPEPGLSRKLETLSVEEGAAYLKNTYGLTQTEEEIARGTLQIVEDFYYREAPLKPGVKEFLESLQAKGIPMVIATSSVREHVEAALRRLGVLHCFARIFTCTEVGAGKTNPLIFEKAGEYIGGEFRDISVFEDAIHALETAKKAGFYTVAVYDPTSEKDWERLRAEADRAVTDLRQLL